MALYCNRLVIRTAYLLVSYSRRLLIDQFDAFSTASVCVMRTNLAWTGLNEMTVRVPLPWPSATGWLHFTPSIETCTR